MAKQRKTRASMRGIALTAERLREVLHYDPETGVFTRKVSRGGRAYAGSVAGTPRPDGYLTICVDWRQYLAHRLAWLYVYGEFPDALIDHIDRNKANNAIANLRQATHSTNGQNMAAPKSNNKSGYLGVIADDDTWLARIVVNGRQRTIGRFDTAERAHQAYVDAKRTFHEFCSI